MSRLEIVKLVDAATGSTAEVLPGLGFNCFRYRPMIDGTTIDVLYSPPDFDTGQQRPSRGGIPLLFPYPGRIRGKMLHWRGRDYALDGDDTHGNAIHGYALNRPWQVVEQQPARVVGRLRGSQAVENLREKWPADFELTVTYALGSDRFAATIEIRNPDDRPLPFGFGMHPWFRVPLVAGGDAANCVVRVPVRERWVLEDMLPSGGREEASGNYDLADGRRFADCQLDDVFTGLFAATPGSDYRATLDDLAVGLRVAITFGQQFTQCVVFTPPHREAVCIEPYTAVPNAPELAERGIDTGLRVLEPGASVRLGVVISIDRMSAGSA
ncbi:MAG TPA: aldose 1-epimerase [Pirellulales bacterium]|jgi:aldose 1-epimerase|nr:aldose 1-epimerase [Pirellulales bacterium]